MSSPSKQAWKNPKDIMRRHRIKRQSSSGPGQASSISMTRRHSFTSISQNADANSKMSLRASSSDDGVNTHVNSTNFHKRRNPFGCDVPLSDRSKRRSILNQDCISPEVPEKESKCNKNELADSASSPENVPCASSQSDQRKLLHILKLAEQMVDGKTLHSGQETEKPSPPIVLDTSKVLQEKPVSSNSKLLEESEHHAKFDTHPLLDWSLKSKLRVVVTSSVESFKKYPGIDAKHVDGFVHHKLENSPEWNDLDMLQQIRQCCMHFSYPQIPWISTFPRLMTDFKTRSMSVASNDEDILRALQKEWSRTFTSVYQQLRSGICPYFYVCAHQFTVLFRCLRTSPDSASWSALLSPSTRGLREMLNKEGIDFRMPNIKLSKLDSGKQLTASKNTEDAWENNKNPTTLPSSQPQLMLDGKTDTCTSINENHNLESSIEPSGDSKNDVQTEPKEDDDDDDEDCDDDDEEDDHDGASRWLEGMGLDKKDFPSLEPLKVKLQREGFREIDNRPQSMLYVEGVDVHPFFNFLLNYPSCIASSGPQHGIPPTILSPVPFVGGTLVQNMIKHTTLKDGTENGTALRATGCKKFTHVFEIGGPILPHHSLNIGSILHTSHDCDTATLSYSTHNPTAPFNTQTENLAEKDKLAKGLCKLFVDYSQANLGLMHDVKGQLLSTVVLENGTAVREMNISPSGFHMASFVA